MQAKCKGKWKVNVKGKCFNHIGRNKLEQEYSMNQVTVQKVNQEVDLEVLVDRELKFHKRVAAAVNKGYQLLGIIRKMFSYQNRIFCHFCSQHWSDLSENMEISSGTSD